MRSISNGFTWSKFEQVLSKPWSIFTTFSIWGKNNGTTLLLTKEIVFLSWSACTSPTQGQFHLWECIWVFWISSINSFICQNIKFEHSIVWLRIQFIWREAHDIKGQKLKPYKIRLWSCGFSKRIQLTIFIYYVVWLHM